MPEQNTTNGHWDAQHFAEAIAIANVPTLLMVLVQLTGDLRWLKEPYQPRRARGMDDNDTGGLLEPTQAEIRQAALEVMWEVASTGVEVPLKLKAEFYASLFYAADTARDKERGPTHANEAN